MTQAVEWKKKSSRIGGCLLRTSIKNLKPFLQKAMACLICLVDQTLQALQQDSLNRQRTSMAGQHCRLIFPYRSRLGKNIVHSVAALTYTHVGLKHELRQSHRFAATRKNFICWVRTCSILKDYIHVFPGGSPIVYALKRVSGVYVVMAHVDGMMQGEAFEVDTANAHNFAVHRRKHGHGELQRMNNILLAMNPSLRKYQTFQIAELRGSRA